MSETGKMSERTSKTSESSCDEETKDESNQRKNKYDLTPLLKEKLKEIPEAMEYIEKLQRLLKKQIKKINKWKSKIKKMQKPKDCCTQTDFHVEFATNNNQKEVQIDVKNDSKSLADDIKEAAEIAMQSSGFVYEETSGMYYDYNTGYYYNAEYGLYYDGNTGTYLKYNQDSQSYEFHSQVEGAQPRQKEEGKGAKKRSKIWQKTKDRKRQRGNHAIHSPTKDVEEGECSDSEDSCTSEEDKSDSTDISKQWPPCMRIIVESSNVPRVKVGSLHIITCDGGSVGREGDHSVVIPDINTSKHHLKLTFEKDSGDYFVTDLGSRNGTLLNGKRLSPSKQESEPTKITHGSRIQIGSTMLLCHIHEGSQTCGHCEPGLIQLPKEVEKEKVIKTSRAERHKNELRNLRKMCGVVHYDEDPKLATGYTDRAQKRRETVGSQNPHEKTKVASLDESISSENKGFKLLSKMGWKEGQSLGKAGEGMLEPIKLVSNVGTTGMGCEDVQQPIIANSEKQNIWKKAQERFQKLPDNYSFIEDSDDSK